MDAIKIAYESAVIGLEVALQKFWMRNLPSLGLVGAPCPEGLTCIVTGPTSGIGRETAFELARRGAHVVLACRSLDRGNALKRAIEQEITHDTNIEVRQLDLSSLESVRQFASAWQSTSPRPIHVLINNAGIFSMSAPRSETIDGFESHIGTNYLGHYLLTILLMPSLFAGAKLLGRPSRVISVSSRLHLMGKIHRDDPNLTQNYNSLAAYAQSKLAQVLFSSELTRRCKGTVIAVAVHPGEVVTDVVRSLPGFIQKLYNIILGAILLSPAEGARSSVYCATSPDVDTKSTAVMTSTGSSPIIYYDSNCAPGGVNPEVHDADLCAWLWNWSAEAVELPSARNL